MKEEKGSENEMKMKCKECPTPEEYKENPEKYGNFACAIFSPCEICGYHGVPAALLKANGGAGGDYGFCVECKHMTDLGYGSFKWDTMFSEKLMTSYWTETQNKSKDEASDKVKEVAKDIFDCGCEESFPIYRQSYLDAPTDPENNPWKILQETGKALEQLAVVCINCEKEKGSEEE